MDDELEQWKQRLRTLDFVASFHALKHIDEHDHAAFVDLCHQLLRDPTPSIQEAVLGALGHLGDPDDGIGEAAALRALDEPTLHDVALIALARIATPAAFPLLLAHAQVAGAWALRAVAWQARTAEQHQLVLELARQLLFAESRHIRTMAVRILTGLSRPDQEEDILLEAARRHMDEIVIASLGQATPRMLPAMRQILAEIGPGYAESKDLQRAIDALEAKMQSSPSS
jgi:hypothetical protein